MTIHTVDSSSPIFRAIQQAALLCREEGWTIERILLNEEDGRALWPHWPAGCPAQIALEAARASCIIDANRPMYIMDVEFRVGCSMMKPPALTLVDISTVRRMRDGMTEIVPLSRYVAAVPPPSS